MRSIKNYYYMFVAGFYEELRNIQEKLFNNLIMVIHYDLKSQKWANKITKGDN